MVRRRGRARDGDTSLLVVVCDDTPPAYLSRLRREEIPYLIAGTERVDLTRALSRMGDLLGARCVVSHAGGGLNGALLRAGSAPVRLRTVDVTVGEHGTVWSRYEVSG
ncbi:hypothetical protein AB0G04_21955 [Actinoplanes sp. NPDC023801]|uniref:hypothetical protein n=1 Tax=Actinoplanes sp. NPDC023801 TaxID=3154595 RepID=UPI0033C3D9C2